jgi:hypothetical protein
VLIVRALAACPRRVMLPEVSVPVIKNRMSDPIRSQRRAKAADEGLATVALVLRCTAW